MPHSLRNLVTLGIAASGLAFAALMAFAVPPAVPTLPTIDPQARQILAAMVNTYRDMAEYSDEETIVATSNTVGIMPQYLNERFTVALRKGFGLLSTAAKSSGEKITVHAFQQDSRQSDTPFLVITIDSRYPGVYIKDAVTDYDEAQAYSFGRVGLGALGGGVLFSERDIGSLLLQPAFQGLRMGQPLVVDGVPCNTVIIELDNERGKGTFTLCIGQKDRLLHRMMMTDVEGDRKTTVLENYTKTRMHGAPRLPFMFPASYFQYTPPHGYRLVKFFLNPPVIPRSVVPPPGK